MTSWTGLTFSSLAGSSLLIYFGAWWLLVPCSVHRGPVGRELLQEEGGSFRARQRNTFQHGEQPCPDGALSLVELNSKGSLIRSSRGEKKDIDPGTTTTFENPWTAQQQTDAEEKGKDPQHFQDEVQCTGIDFLSKHDGFTPAWHKRERVMALTAIIADPATATGKVCPKSASDLSTLETESDAAISELDTQVAALTAHYGDNDPNAPINPGAVVHMAQTENEIRTLLGKPTMPMTVDFLATNWVPLINDLEEKMQANGCSHNNCATQVHSFLCEYQLEAIRQSLISSGSDGG